MEGADTIAAIATARGRAALAIVRVSGPEAVQVAARCFQGADLTAAAAGTAHVGQVVAPSGEVLDQVVATVFRAPRTATGEDVVELTCHGGDVAAPAVLRALVAAGARLALPGEFTQRAFLNGKLDLAQAEAIADLIHASSAAAHRVSLEHVRGRYSAHLQHLRASLLELCALLELELDFAEEDVAFADPTALRERLEEARQLTARLLGSWHTGRMVRDGVRVVIAGRPNAGKSTLLNALVGRDRAITSPTPGTTRDEIEAELELDGLLLRVVDTAGLRDTSDAVEAEGVVRAMRSAEGADVVVYVLDVAAPCEEDAARLRTLQELRGERPLVVAGNKVDLAPAPPAAIAGLPVVALSARRALADEQALMPLLDALRHHTSDALRQTDGSAIVMNERHRQHLAAVQQYVAEAQGALEGGSGTEIVVSSLHAAAQELGAITGEVTREDVLDQIFGRFCIGK